MRYLVTGGRGFIGSHIVRRLKEEGHYVMVMDSVHDVFGNIARPETYTSTILEPPYDAVIHLAAQPSAAKSFDDPVADMRVNQYGTYLLLKWCKEKGIKRFIFASTMGVYGSHIQPVHETAQCNPPSYYGVHKLAAEGYVNMSGLDTTILRLFTVYGPGQDLDSREQGMVSIYLSYVLAKERIVVRGSLERWRDFVYIDDVVDVFCGTLHNPGTFGQTYNVGTGKVTRVGKLIRMLLDYSGYYWMHRQEPPTLGDIHGICADISRIRTETSWTPKVSLEEGIRRTVEWANTIT